MCVSIQAHLILLRFPLLFIPDSGFLSKFFHKLKVCGNPAPSKSVGAILLTVFAHFLSLHHINSCTIGSFSIIVIFVVVICGVTRATTSTSKKITTR